MTETLTSVKLTAETYSPYKAAKLINALLSERELDKVIPAQMIYNYTKKGYIPSQMNSDNHIVITHENLTKWFEIYVKRAELNAQLKALTVANS